MEKVHKVTKKKMYLKMVFSSILRRRSRMIIALLAVAIGATIISGLMTIYYDIPKQMGKAFRNYGANLIFTPSDGNSYISGDDYQKVKKQLNNYDVIGLTGYNYQNISINEIPIVIVGTDFNNVKKTSPYWYINGRWAEKDNEIMIGKDISVQMNLRVGKTITLTGKSFDNNDIEEDFVITGIIETGKNEEELVFINQEKLISMFNIDNSYSVIEVSIVAQKEELEKIILDFEETNKNIKPRLVKRVTDSEKSVLSKLQTLVYLVTIIVLVLTMICVATTMMASVLERKNEIGLKKALGASNKSVLLDFLGEGVLIGILGGVLGVILGFIFADQVGKNVFGYGVSIQPIIIIITILISIITTAFASLLPVRRASDIEPALVLKGE